jgi:HlyD family secretion protein
MAPVRLSKTALVALAYMLLVVGCRDEARAALGTLEYERITFPAPVAEPIVEVAVHEGERVAPGTVLLRLDATRLEAELEAARAEAERRRQALVEAEAGPREETIDEARASLASARATARNARRYHARLARLGAEQVVAPAEVDEAAAAAAAAVARVEAAEARVTELLRGTRSEELAQARAALAAAEQQAEARAALLDELTVTATRAGVVDSLPYRRGDEAPLGAPLAILLVGAPYARAYVPEPIRAGVRVGDRARVVVEGDEREYAGRVRTIRSDPSFTPYYALTGEDAARLSYLAEVSLVELAARELPAGLPVRVTFAPEARG